MCHICLQFYFYCKKKISFFTFDYSSSKQIVLTFNYVKSRHDFAKQLEAIEIVFRLFIYPFENKKVKGQPNRVKVLYAKSFLRLFPSQQLKLRMLQESDKLVHLGRSALLCSEL